ncbi:MAG: alpha/beta hydrolase [Candidatus Micrarchaeota archaeon]
MKLRYLLILVLAISLLGCISLPQTPAGGTTQPPVAVVNKTVPAAEQVEINVGTTENGNNSAAAVEEEVKKADSKEIHFRTTDQWDIYASVYYAKITNPEKAIVLLHQFGSDRSDFDSLVPVLRQQFPDYDIVVLDMRGHGKSTNLGSYSKFQTGDFRAMKNDLKALKVYEQVNRPSMKKYYLVGSSLGSSVALDYAVDDSDVFSVIMISPGLNYQGYDVTEKAQSYLRRLFLAVAEQDTYSKTSADQIYSTSPSDIKDEKVYYGIGAHGNALFAATASGAEPLSSKIVSWLNR